MEEKKKILIIDDEERICSLVKRGLETMGDFEVNLALSGDAGLAAVQENKPHLILLDIAMAGKYDGFNVLKKLKGDQSTSDIPVILLTAFAGLPMISTGAQIPYDLYLQKPVDLLFLKNKIEEVLKAHEVK